MSRNDIKLLAKNERESKILVQTHEHMANVFESNLQENSVILIIRSRKRQIMEVTERQNQERIRTLREKENYKYLGNLYADTIRKAKMKGK